MGAAPPPMLAPVDTIRLYLPNEEYDMIQHIQVSN